MPSSLDQQAYEFQPATETHMITSRHVEQVYKIEVMQPARLRGQAPPRLPVIYATDGNRVFAMLKGISELLQASGHDAPPFILVGVGYPTEASRGGAMLRTRDFTFAGRPAFPLTPPLVEGMLAAEPGRKDLFGATEFRDFLEFELIPFIDGRYPTIAGDRTYYGHSGGGGFGLFAMLTKPALFRNIIASSPSLAYEGTVAGVHYKASDLLLQPWLDAVIADGSMWANTTLYLSVGSSEETEPGLEPWHLVSSSAHLVALLREAGVAGLTLITELFERETHMTVWPMSFVHGVQAVFGRGRWASHFTGENQSSNGLSQAARDV